MIKNGYQEIINVKYSEIEQNKALKPYSLLNFLQDIASKNAEDLGFGYSFINPRNYAWFLIKYHMEFNQYPFDIQELKLVTEPRGYNKLFAYRDFEIYSKENLLARITSMWSIVDIESRSIKPIHLALESNPLMKPFQKREEDLSFGKISTLENPVCEKSFEVRYNDLDVNRHANNGNYIVWAFETIDYKYRDTHKIQTLDIIFKKEASFGEKIISQMEFKDNKTTIHRLQNAQGEDLCLLECTWSKIS